MNLVSSACLAVALCFPLKTFAQTSDAECEAARVAAQEVRSDIMGEPFDKLYDAAGELQDYADGLPRFEREYVYLHVGRMMEAWEKTHRIALRMDVLQRCYQEKK